MISCNEAVTICNKKQYREAGLRQRWQLWLHLLVCKHCATFSRRNRRLTELCKEARIRQLSDADKARLRKNLEEARGA